MRLHQQQDHIRAAVDADRSATGLLAEVVGLQQQAKKLLPVVLGEVPEMGVEEDQAVVIGLQVDRLVRELQAAVTEFVQFEPLDSEVGAESSHHLLRRVRRHSRVSLSGAERRTSQVGLSVADRRRRTTSHCCLTSMS